MNPHERRAHKAYTRPTEYMGPPGNDQGGMMINADGAIPQDIKADVARVVCAISFPGLDGGDCYMRAAIGYKVLSLLGWHPEIRIGGIVFRAGPHPIRDVVSFCGPHNAGTLIGGEFFGHIWLDLDGDAVDFTGCEWRRHLGAPKDGLGPVQWQRDPPSLIWAPEDMFDWQEDGTRSLARSGSVRGRARLPEFAYDRARIIDAADVFTKNINRNIEGKRLVERLRDYRRMPEEYAANGASDASRPYKGRCFVR